jgi:hypothetical protein
MAAKWGRPTPGVGRTWPTSRPGAFQGGVATKAPDHLPYVQMAGNRPPIV